MHVASLRNKAKRVLPLGGFRKGPVLFPLALAVFLGGATDLAGQGEIFFNNRVSGVFAAPIFGPEPGDPTLAKHGNPTNGIPAGSQVYYGAPLAGSGYTAQLFAGRFGTAESNLYPTVPTLAFRTGAAAGYLQMPAPTVVIPGVAEGSQATLQVRVWENRGGTVTNWAQTLADPSVLRGASTVFVSLALGGCLSSGPNLIGLTSFNIHAPEVMEVPPTILVQPQSQTVFVGTNVTFTVTANGPGTLGFQWRHNETDIPGATQNTLILANVQESQAGTYSVVVTNAFGSATSSNATLTVVNSLPIITAQPEGRSVRAGDWVTFSVTAIGNLPLNYQWRFNETLLPGATNTSLTLANLQTNATGNYSVVVSNAAGAVASSNALLTVWPRYGRVVLNNRVAGLVIAAIFGPEPNDPALAKHGNPTNGYPAGTQTYTGALLEGAGYTAQLWGGPLGTEETNLQPALQGTTTFGTGANAGFIVVPGADPLVPGVADGERATLQLRVWDNRGGTVTNWDTVLADNTVDRGKSLLFDSSPLPAYLIGLSSFNIHLPGAEPDCPPSIYTQPQSQSGNWGATVNFWVGVTGTRPLSYQWQFSGADIAGATNSLLVLSNITPSATGDYSVVITNVAGTAVSTDALLTVVDGEPGSIILNNRISGSVIAPVYGVEPGDPALQKSGNTPSGYPAGGQTYGGAPLSGPGFSAQLWAGPLGSREDELQPAIGVLTTFRTGETAGFFVTPAPTVVIHGVPPAYRATAQMRAWDNRNGTVTNWPGVLADPTVPRGLSALFETLPLGGILQTPPHLVGLTSFNLYVPAPLILSQPQSQTVIAGTNISIEVMASGTAPLAFRWRFNGVEIPGAVSPRLELYSVQRTNSGDYAVRVSNACGETVSSNAVLTVVSPPVLISTLDAAGQGCKLTLVGEPRCIYQVETSTNLTTWNWFCTVTNRPDEIELTITNGCDAPSRFYRAFLVP